MIQLLKIPTREETARLLAEAEERNPGPWVQHSRFVAQAAERIAARHPGLDPEAAYRLGCLHDIGRRGGSPDLRHTLDGYLYLSSLGFTDAAQICLTHSFPVRKVEAASGVWDCSAEELAFIADLLANAKFTLYDELIQLCDALALPTGFCLIEKRLVDVALRRGVNEFTVEKWKAFLRIQADFERAIGQSIYSLLPGVVETTFGLALSDG